MDFNELLKDKESQLIKTNLSEKEFEKYAIEEMENAKDYLEGEWECDFIMDYKEKVEEVPVDYFEEIIYFHRDKEDNWDIISQAEELDFDCPRDLAYLGNELGIKVRIDKDCKKIKIIKIEGVDVSDKDIYI